MDGQVVAGRCQCGCGLTTRVAARSHKDGRVKGQHNKFVAGHSAIKPRSLTMREYVAKRCTHAQNGCWNWTQSTNHSGYGVGIFNMKKDLAHRLSWRAHRGDIPAGMFVCHHCDNPGCVNPDHLFLGTPADNVRDMLAKGRQSKPGDACWRGHVYVEGSYRWRADAPNSRTCLVCEQISRDARRAGRPLIRSRGKSRSADWMTGGGKRRNTGYSLVAS